MEGSPLVKLVIGLGNPGRKYARTRHNVAWLALDDLARAWQIESEQARCGGLLARKGEVGLFKPLTYMNHSGQAAASLVAESAVSMEDLLVLVDDLSLVLGTVRMRGQGSAGGHRGLESVIDWLGTPEFPRLRLGIGPRPPEMTARQFVLSPFCEEELPLVERMIERAALAAQCWATDGLETAMSRYNGAVEEMN